MKISDILLNGINKDYFLPSLQREFVWGRSEQRIENLFDSILQGYPIGAIVVWKLNKDAEKESIRWEVYKFFENYDEEDPHNEEQGLNGISKLNLVLDGQQRLTALNIGLRGSYAYTAYNRNRETRLYINLFSNIEKSEDNTYGLKYEFKFLEYIPENENEYWFEIGKVLDYVESDAEEFKGKYEEDVTEKADGDQERAKKALKTLGSIWTTFCNTDVITEIPVYTSDDEKVLNIFVRTNDGGLKLEKSDMLLSYMESNPYIFKPNRARKEINSYLDEVNTEKVDKPNYYLTKDDILKACLVLTDDLSVQYKLANFNKTNLKLIDNNWKNIKKHFLQAVNLIAAYGFSYKNLTSKNAIIPIAYFFLLNKTNDSFIYSNKESDLKQKHDIMRWLAASLLGGAFGGSSDSTLSDHRKKLNEGKTFKDLSSDRNVDADTITKWVDREKYGSRYSHLLLMLITPDKYWHNCHQDHIYPISKFTKQELDKYDIKEIDQYQQYANSIYNLHLINPSVNIAKSNDDFINWADAHTAAYLEKALVPTSENLDFPNFLKVMELRRANIIDELKQKFKVK